MIPPPDVPHEPAGQARETPPPAPSAAEFVRTAGAWLLVMALAAAGLKVADALPRVALGVPRGVRTADDIGHLERLAGRRMPVPSYYPDTVGWPPSEGRLHMDGSAAFWCLARATGAPALVVATAPPGGAGIASEVLPASVELQREEGSLGGRSAIVARVRGADGSLWQQVQWRSRSQIILVRYRGTLDELLRIAGSMHE